RPRSRRSWTTPTRSSATRVGPGNAGPTRRPPDRSDHRPQETLMTATPVISAPARGPAAPPSAARRRSRWHRVRHHLTGHAFLLGTVVCFAFFSWYPMVKEILMSFQRTRRGVTSWVGWDNYERIWDDPAFGPAWRNTLLFTGLALVLGY